MCHIKRGSDNVLFEVMEKAIEKAISGGYKDKWKVDFGSAITSEQKSVMLNTFSACYLMDKDFWQALGKAEGWDKNYVPSDVIYRYKEKEWQGYWHKFIDALAEGKDINSFFEELLI